MSHATLRQRLADGERAFGIAHDGYGATDPSVTMHAANDEIELIGLIETVQGIERCEEIMAVPGLDVGWLGHYDLTNEMGITAQFDDPRFLAAAERLAKACAAAGKTPATLDANPAFLRAQMARGYGVALAGVAIALGACSHDPEPSPASAAGLANPASENCIAKGGELHIGRAGDGGEYGVCLFEDNRQCEEWALLRGECPAGGIRVTGYVTPQARYCAIRGGDYVVTREETATTSEEGSCTLPGESTCDALALYEGRCPR